MSRRDTVVFLGPAMTAAGRLVGYEFLIVDPIRYITWAGERLQYQLVGLSAGLDVFIWGLERTSVADAMEETGKKKRRGAG